MRENLKYKLRREGRNKVEIFSHSKLIEDGVPEKDLESLLDGFDLVIGPNTPTYRSLFLKNYVHNAKILNTFYYLSLV